MSDFNNTNEDVHEDAPLTDDENARSTLGHNNPPHLKGWQFVQRQIEVIKSSGKKVEGASLSLVHEFAWIIYLVQSGRRELAYAMLPVSLKECFVASRKKITAEDLLNQDWKAGIRDSEDANKRSRVKLAVEFLLERACATDDEFREHIAQFKNMDSIRSARTRGEPKGRKHQSKAADKRRQAAVTKLAGEPVGICPLPDKLRDLPAEGEARIMLATRGTDSDGELSILHVFETGGELGEHVHRHTTALINIAVKQRGLTIGNAK